MAHKILIADDDKINLVLMANMLKTSNQSYTVLTVTDGEMAFQVAQTENPSLILIDWEMPVMSGIESIKLLKANPLTREIPIIMETGLASSRNLQEALDAGAIDYIRKPIDKIELLARVKSALMLNDSLKEIKNQKQRIEQQIDELNRLSLIVKQTDNSVVIANVEGEIEWANEGFKKIYGYTLDEFKEEIGSSIFETSNDIDFINKIEQIKKTRTSVTYITKRKTKDNSFKWIQTTITPIFDGNNIEKFVAIETDNTIQKEAEIKLQENNDNLKKLSDDLAKTNTLLERQKQAIDEERRKSEQLLLNILPHHVALQLKSSGYAKPRDYSKATVMFTDFQGFTRACETLSPDEIVSYLHTFFTEFDDIIVRHFIEKIKTIGDAYMCAGGLPLRNRSNPFDVVLAGLEIQLFMRNALADESLVDIPRWNLRVGIHTGAVTAGVVGKIKFAYDIWGDSVNIAKRIESACEIGRVNISGTTYEFIKDYFDCEFRGEIEIKNRGIIEMYFVNGIKEEYAADIDRVKPNEKFMQVLNSL